MSRDTPNPARRDEGDPLQRRVLLVCDAVGDFIEYWGFKAVHGRIWTLLALAGRPMSQRAVADTLGLARSTVSTAVAELARYGLLRATGPHRQAPYEAVLDVWPTIADVLRQREWLLIERARTALEAAIEEAELASVSGRPVPYDVERMRLLLGMTEIAQALCRLLIGMRVPRTVDASLQWVRRFANFIRDLGRRHGRRADDA